MGLQYMIKHNEVYNPRICDIVKKNAREKTLP